MKLLDTTFLIHYWGGHDAVRTYLATNDDAEFVSTTLNLKELAVGRALQGALDAAELAATFEWVKFLPFDRDHATAAATLEAPLHRADDVQQDEINSLAADLLIAAVAKTERATVVTRNVSGFERFEDVTVETY